MSKDDCKQRFKGVENFLRRVAFNLGNTPSQTEVKVISCIPIDVTDLQQKIIQLEKQLEAANCNTKCTTSQRETSIVHTAICNPIYHKCSNAGISCKAISCCQSSIAQYNPNCLAKPQKSTVSFINLTEPNQTQDCYFSADVESGMSYTKKRNPTEGRKNFFSKRKIPKKKKLKTQLIYYAQTEDRTPFNSYSLGDGGTSKNRCNDERNHPNGSYLSNIVRKQYKPGAVNDGTNLSDFSTPICRDVVCALKGPGAQPYESDMCSCCHGPFTNIDNHMSQHNRFDMFSSHTDSNNAYYDSNLYDVVPVKENAIKIKTIEFPKRKETKKQMNITCCPGNIHPRYKVPPMIVNYNTTAPTRHTKNSQMKAHRKEKVLNKMSKKPILYGSVNRTYVRVPKTRSVEFSEVYAKRLERSRRKFSKLKPTKVTNRNDAACLTTVDANTECQEVPANASANAANAANASNASNASSQQSKIEEVANVTQSDDKTKVTLNQIKEILQSVLTEVKTNNKTGTYFVPTKKKDAVVQNGLSQSNIYGGSSLLHTFTYSPYEMDQHGPSCSQQIQNNNLCYQNMALSSIKCMQHYPLFVQPQGRNMCASSYGNNQQLSNLPNMKRAASTATNTEHQRARSKETDNLIKEIYKAMALNIDIPDEDKSVQEHGYKNQTITNYNTRTGDRETKNIAKAISEIFKNTNPIDTSVSRNTETPLESQLPSNETTFRSQTARSYAQSIRKESANYYSNDENSVIVVNEREQVSRRLESDEESDGTIVNERTESSVTDTESGDDKNDNNVLMNVLPVKKPNKETERGLFSKMFDIFRPRSKNTKSNKADKKSDIDSVVPRTMHGRKDFALKQAPRPFVTKSRAVVFYSKKPQQPKKQIPATVPQKSPYMEQEYRRYFDEKLTFHDNHQLKSSTRGTPPRKKPVYYQKVEARSALVDHYIQRNGPVSKIDTKSVRQLVKSQEMSRSRSNSPGKVSIVPPKAITWLKKHKLGNKYGKWKKFILES